MKKPTVAPVLLPATLIAFAALTMSPAVHAEESLLGELSSDVSNVVSSVDPTPAPTAEQAIKLKEQLATMATDTLQQLYSTHPQAEEAVKKGYGYAVFKSSGINLVLYVAGEGKGVAYDNATKTPIYMKMMRAGTGPGVGYEDYRQVLIFDNESLYNEFINVGLQGSLSANATVKMGGEGVDEGIAHSLVPGVTVYQLTDKGLDIQANWGGTEYLRDSDLD